MGRNYAMKDARTRAGLSQQELADRLGVSRQTINAIEKGDYNPTIRLCVGICRVLGLTLNDLFWEEEETKKKSTKISENNACILRKHVIVYSSD